MGRFVLGYGFIRNVIIRNRKAFGTLGCLVFCGFLFYSYLNEGRPGKVHSMHVDYDGPDLFDSFSIDSIFPSSFDTESLKKLAIGETGLNPLDTNKVVENLIEMEEEALIQARAASNKTLFDRQPVFDADGNEIGLRFLVVSDWGGKPKAPYTTNAQMKVGKAMADLSAKYDCSFVLSLGDNFYDKGVKNVEDMRFEDTFEDVFTQQSLQRPWYVVAGDVDYRGNVSAQIEYSKKSSRWMFKSKYYKMSAELSTFKNISVDFFLIDTVELCGRLPPSGLTQPMGPDNIAAAEEQWSWLNKELKNSQAEYLIVAGHYPVYSGGIHGSTKCLVDRLQPMLKEYHVSAYFSGHDHSMQHIKANGEGGVHYFVSASTNDMDDRPDHLDGIYKSTRYFWTNHLDRTTGAFTYCDVRKNQLTVAFVHNDQTVLYTAQILPRSHPSNKIPEADVTDDTVVKIPVLKKHKPVAPVRPKPIVKQRRPMPLPYKMRPKSREELQIQERKIQQQRQMMMQQHALRNANRAMRRYRGP